MDEGDRPSISAPPAARIDGSLRGRDARGLQNYLDSFDIPPPAPVSPPPSCIHERRDHAKFLEELTLGLQGLDYKMRLRVNLYGEKTASEYLPGLTPREVVEERNRRREAWLETLDFDTPSDYSSQSCDNAGAPPNEAVLGKRNAAPTQRHQPSNLPTPPPSEDTGAQKAVQSRKRRRDDDMDKEEAEERPTKIRNIASAKSGQQFTLAQPRRSARLAARSAQRQPSDAPVALKVVPQRSRRPGRLAPRPARANG
jgi:hypothetical protein